MSQRVLDFLSRPEVWAVAAALCGFLTLTWVLRGAPIGQATREEPGESPASGYRDRVVASAVIGFLLVLAGAYLAATVGIPWSIPAFAAGFGIVLAVLRVNRRYRHVSPTLRRVLEFSNTALTASLLAGILVVGNVVAFKYGGRAIDLTRDRAFSLSSRTDEPAQGARPAGRLHRLLRQLRAVGPPARPGPQMLDLYKAANPSKVRVEYLDPNTDIKEFEALASRVPDVVAIARRRDRPGVRRRGGRALDARRHGRAVRGARGPVRGQARPVRLDRSTARTSITSALIRLREGKTVEDRLHDAATASLRPAELDPLEPGLGLWRARLASIGTDVVEVEPACRDEVPEDVALLVICGPRSPFQAGRGRADQGVHRPGRPADRHARQRLGADRARGAAPELQRRGRQGARGRTLATTTCGGPT